MISTMLVDLDHLWANPIYDMKRCSVGFHPLHQLFPIGIYFLLSLSPYYLRSFLRNSHSNLHRRCKLNVKLLQYLGLGLLLHMALDSIDCQLNTGAWLHGV